MAWMFALRSVEERALRSVERPEGSPTAPVAPPICEAAGGQGDGELTADERSLDWDDVSSRVLLRCDLLV